MIIGVPPAFRQTGLTKKQIVQTDEKSKYKEQSRLDMYHHLQLISDNGLVEYLFLVVIVYGRHF
jgi:hypothetical protein